jgi:hypothetical protein
MQWRPFYPRLNGDLKAWAKADTWNMMSLDHPSSDQEDSSYMYDRLALQIWYERSRRA